MNALLVLIICTLLVANHSVEGKNSDYYYFSATIVFEISMVISTLYKTM